ncbi:ABC bile acid transporter, putative [Cordyceps militaris CM01]|uniref:ABC bile acid transporter, putative n=1 Tax=Cordyceps militaris (strain CM01) TaxID=983644 RepID=G3JRU1_CORMM|nr:ABC bile acid transporter, putative [Cordyceps militaris CM01]EGX88534.1 ABC bile acid transporter, putative [Cordyceps militaris CM01]
MIAPIDGLKETMRQDSAHVPTLASVAAVVTATSLSLLTLRQFLGGAQHTCAPKEIYHDEDGEATKDSEALCSAAAQKAIIDVATAAGLSIAVYDALAVGAVPRQQLPANAVEVVIWALLSVQALILSLEQRFQQRYAHGFRLGSSAALCLLWILYRAAAVQEGRSEAPWSEIGSLLAVFLASWSIPRRPVVFRQGLQVDSELSVSFWSRLAFSWGPFHASRSAIPHKIQMDLLPEVSHSSRVARWKPIWTSTRGDNSVHLWKQLMRAFLPTLIVQWCLAFASAASQFGSRFALFKLLQCLEKHGQPSNSASAWVAGLGTGLLIETLSHSWLIWFTQMKLQIPVEGLLKSLVVDKLTRRPLAPGKGLVPKQASNAKSAGQFEYPSLTDILTNHCQRKSSQETANACAHTHHFLVAIFKLCLDVHYLSRLLGTKSILAGTIVSMLLVPLSAKLSQRYRAARAKRTKAHSAVSNLVSEALQSLRHIRLASMEGVWQDRLGAVRDQELDQMWSAGIAMSLLSLAVNLGPVLLVCIALSMYAYGAGHLSPSIAFLALNLFDNLQSAFQELPSRFAEARVSWSSCRLLHQYLSEPERERPAVSSEGLGLENAFLRWHAKSSDPNLQDEFTLSGVNVAFPPAALSIVTGSTGSGKSLLLSALLEEANIGEGRLLRPPVHSVRPESSHEKVRIKVGSTALVSQPPWIENCSILDNILFGNVYDDERYKATLDACALDHDLSVLPGGDQTIAGLNGAFLSGGQKWRVALARAFYSTAEILILDDVLSAVDAHVAQRLCERGLMGELARGRTVILATHSPNAFLDTAKYHVTVENNRAIGKAISRTAVLERKNLEPAQAGEGYPDPILNLDKESEKPENPKSSASLPTMRTGQILSAYIWASGGVWSLVMGVLLTLLSRAVTHSSSWWLSRWTVQDKTSADHSVVHNIKIYFALSLSTVIGLELISLILLGMSLTASRSLFRRLVRSVLYAPLTWIDSMPLGEMIQVLETDIYTLDNKTTQSLHNLLGSLANLVFILTSSAAVLVIYSRAVIQQLAISRQLFRLIDESLRPVLEHASSIASGLATIRAFDRTDFYIERMDQLVDRSAKLGLHLILGQRWLAVRLGALGAVFVTIVAATLVYQEEDAGKAGLIITLALQLKDTLSGTTTMFNLHDMLARTIGQIVSLSHVETESQEGNEPPRSSWATDASLRVCNLVVGYEASARPALRAVSFSVEPGQRLGIVGRTGSGKTSLINALARFINPTQGQIFLNGVDISTIKVKRLREALALIPQDPFLFSGTLRSNVDPCSTATDERLLEVLRRARLIQPGASIDDKTLASFSDLDMPIQARGVNLSYGQRQLICLARALLVESPIVLLDEATSGVDDATDAAVQSVIRQEFSQSTIIVVAHRLLTVADFDRVLVMRDGEVVEFGPPATLMARRGLFWDMVQKSGDTERITLAMQTS